METTTMGQVVVSARIENTKDLWEVEQGLRRPEQVRAVDLSQAVVDTGAVMLSLPKRFIAQLGLAPFTTRRMRTTAGPRDANICGPVKLTVQGRYCTTDVSEIDDDCPVLIGQIPLEMLDFVVDPNGRKLIGNPEHGGEWMYDQF